jgi:hypothetical protein
MVVTLFIQHVLAQGHMSITGAFVMEHMWTIYEVVATMDTGSGHVEVEVVCCGAALSTRNPSL